MAKNKSKEKSTLSVAKKSKTILKRKQLRLEKKQAKKCAKKDFVNKKFKVEVSKDNIENSNNKKKVKKKKNKNQSDHDKVKRDMKELQRQQKKQRKKQLSLANEAEEKNIKALEKNLGMKRRKSKNLPKSFLDDGLDYLLDACDSTKIANFEKEEMDDEVENSDILEELELMEEEDELNQGTDDDEDKSSDNNSDNNDDYGDHEMNEDEDVESDVDAEDDNIEDADDIVLEEGDAAKEEEFWEDIYGRKRDTKGNLVTQESQNMEEPLKSKYIPPAMRAKLGSSEEKSVILERLSKKIKGLLNRLAESNMHGISRDIERFYNCNSRNDVNRTLTDLLMSSLVHETALIPSRLIMEHCMLVAVLHANVGTEVGAFVLQEVVQKFGEEHRKASDDEEASNAINNLLVIINYLYAWKIVQSSLVFDILKTLVDRFNTKDIQLIILTLTNCGMSLRKDDPVALKAFIQSVQTTATHKKAEDSRVQFMLEILNGIKNNNVNKIPNYDPSHFEHLRKSFKSLLREGSFVTELNISYQDLIKAESKGRWWIVGSAFTGNLVGSQQDGSKGSSQASSMSEQYSDKLLELARKLRMNTEIRRNIFCIIMSSEDFMDCTDKLVKLGTKNQTDREVVFVLTDCCLQEKQFNPYYGHVAVRLAGVDRKYRVAMQFNIWDRIKQIDQMKKFQIENLALFCKFLIVERVQSLGLLKVIEFADLDKCNMKLLKCILSGILQELDADKIYELFKAVSQDSKLSVFRESLKLFMNHFLLKQVEGSNLENLKSRIKIAEKGLASSTAKFRL